MFEWIIETIGQGIFWGFIGLIVGYLTGWQVPQSPWGKWAQENIPKAYQWIKALF